MIIIFEGPEKAGKTTLINNLAAVLKSRGYLVSIRKFTGPMTSEDQYLQPLLQDREDPKTITIWDRGWVSEYVYSTFYNRQSTLTGNSNRAEIVFTSIVNTCGLKYVVLPHDIREIESRRDPSDLDISPLIEYVMFCDYAYRHKWPIITTDYTQAGLVGNSYKILADVEKWIENESDITPDY